MHDDSHDARLWDAGYIAGQRDEREGRNLLADKYPPDPDNLIDFRQWRLAHGRCACARRAAGGSG